MWQSLKRWWHYLGMKLRVAQEEHADPEGAAGAGDPGGASATPPALATPRRSSSPTRSRPRTASTPSSASARRRRRRPARPCSSSIVRRATATRRRSPRSRPRPKGLANRVLTLEREVRDLDDALLQASAAAEDAKAAVVRNAKELEQQLDDRERLLSVLDRAKMQEALNQAHEQLSMLPGADVPTYAQVERKILGRQAVAEAKGELNAAQFTAGVDPAMLEIEAAQRSAEAQAFLAQMRSQLGLAGPDEGAGTPPRMIER